MKNTLSCLESRLYDQLDRLSNPNKRGEELLEEINRGRAINETSGQILAVYSLRLRAQIAKDNSPGGKIILPKSLED